MRTPRNNPYEVLIVAALFFLPSVLLLMHKGPAMMEHAGSPPGRYGGVPGIQIWPESIVHCYGVALLVMSLSIAAFYFYLRHQLWLEENIPHLRRCRRTKKKRA
jgi:hypothetical protein